MITKQDLAEIRAADRRKKTGPEPKLSQAQIAWAWERRRDGLSSKQLADALGVDQRLLIGYFKRNYGSAAPENTRPIGELMELPAADDRIDEPGNIPVLSEPQIVWAWERRCEGYSSVQIADGFYIGKQALMRYFRIRFGSSHPKELKPISVPNFE